MVVFNTTQAWVTRLEPEFFFGEEKLAQVRSYAYIGGTGPCLSLQEAAWARLSHGYAALSAHGRHCAH